MVEGKEGEPLKRCCVDRFFKYCFLGSKMSLELERLAIILVSGLKQMLAFAEYVSLTAMIRR